MKIELVGGRWDGGTVCMPTDPPPGRFSLLRDRKQIPSAIIVDAFNTTPDEPHYTYTLWRRTGKSPVYVPE